MITLGLFYSAYASSELHFFCNTFIVHASSCFLHAPSFEGTVIFSSAGSIRLGEHNWQVSVKCFLVPSVIEMKLPCVEY
jgi:hypothetical protein